MSRLSPHHARVVAVLVRTMTPAFPRLDDVAAAEVLRDVTDFVISQIEALPSFLGVPYRVAITGFNWLAVLRYGNLFVALAPAKRSACVTFWSDGRIGVMRNFVKLIRSCALLAYFDHPRVREALGAAAHPAAANQRLAAVS